MIVFSDLHVHNYKKFDIQGSRLKNCLDVLDIIFEAAVRDDGFILFCGDLFDKQIQLPTVVINDVIERFTNLFERYKTVTFIAISGNHDHASKNLINKKAVTALASLDTVFERFILLDDSVIQVGHYSIAGIPYYEHIEDFNNVVAKTSSTDILMIHQSPIGISNKYIHADLNINTLSKFKLVLCGHIHKREKLSDNFHVVGSPLHRDAGDVGEIKGYYILKDLRNLEFVPIPDFPVFSSTDESSGYYVPPIEKLLGVETNYNFSIASDKGELLKNYLETENKIHLLELALECL